MQLRTFDRPNLYNQTDDHTHRAHHRDRRCLLYTTDVLADRIGDYRTANGANRVLTAAAGGPERYGRPDG